MCEAFPGVAPLCFSAASEIYISTNLMFIFTVLILTNNIYKPIEIRKQKQV